MKNLVLSGHYGSGKTQICVNLALLAKKHREEVAVCDLDIVNPYYRTIDCRTVLADAGIRLISSEYAGGNIEVPGLPPEAAAVFDNPEMISVIDVGGDERGALVLGRYAERLRDSAEMLLVVNCYRPLTREPRDAEEICREIERAARLRFTGMINNSNLGAGTTAEDVLRSGPYAKEIAKHLDLPIRYTSVRTALLPELEGKIENLLPLLIFQKPEWRVEEVKLPWQS